MAKKAHQTAKRVKSVRKAPPPPPAPATGNSESSDTSQHCTVVGFGASAGGMEAFTEVLTHMPVDSNLALVFIQHLDPRHQSVLTELLARSTPMTVLEIKDGMAVKPNHVYVIPPNASVSISNGVLHTGERSLG